MMKKTKAIFEIDEETWNNFKIACLKNKSFASKEIRNFIITYLKK